MSTDYHLHTAPEPNVAAFIRKVYNILEDRLFPDCIDWSVDGTALVIKKPAEFAQKVLPNYFKHNHISSFVRQLNMYGFQKKRSRVAGHVYMHELFQKGQKHLLPKIKRKVKDNNNSNHSQPSQQGTNSPLTFNESSSIFGESHKFKDVKEEAFMKIQHSLSPQSQTLYSQMHQKKYVEHSRMDLFTSIKHEEGMETISPTLSKKILKQEESFYSSYRRRETFDKSSSIVLEPSIKYEVQGNMIHLESLRPKQKPEIKIKVESCPQSGNRVFTLSEFGNSLYEAINSRNMLISQKLSQACQSPDQQCSEWAGSQLSKPTDDSPSYNSTYNREVKLNPNPFQSTILEKRSLNIDESDKMLEEDGLDESINKYLRCDSPRLELSTFGKLQSNFFNPWGENEVEKRPDTEIDLMCFM